MAAIFRQTSTRANTIIILCYPIKIMHHYYCFSYPNQAIAKSNRIFFTLDCSIEIKTSAMRDLPTADV
jgi:hypothetical protein